MVRIIHLVLGTAWSIMLPVSLITGWIYAIAFVSACSIYANAVTHFGAYLAGKAEKEARNGK